MSHKWKFLPIAALFALGAFMLSTGSDLGRVSNVSADDPEITVSVDSNPEGGIGYAFEYSVDANDTESESEDCEDDNDGFSETLDDDEDGGFSCDEDALFDVTISVDVPNHSELADVSCEATDGDTAGADSTIDDSDVDEDGGDIDITVADNESINCDFTFDFDEDAVTPSATSTAAVGPAATINVSSSNDSLGCGATSIVTITVLDSDGDPVAAGTLVNIVADKGSVSPASGQTTADGSVFVFYTASNTQGGEAVITAASGSALGTTEIDVNCNTQPTQAPPPTQPVGGGIQPPNTGDGGLSTSNTWQPYAGVALILSSVIATLAAIRPRRT